MPLTEATVAAAIKLAKDGAPMTLVARSMGYDKDTFTDWLHLGKTAKDPNVFRYIGDATPQQTAEMVRLAEKLVAGVTKAQALAATKLVAGLAKSAKKGNVNAATWLLDRLTPEFKPDTVLVGPGGVSVQFVVPPNGRDAP